MFSTGLRGVSIWNTLHRHWKKEVSFNLVRSCSSNTADAPEINTTTATNMKEVATTTPDKTFIQDVVFNEYSEKPYYHKPGNAAVTDYNVIYTKNTIISASRALSDYLLTLEDLGGMRKTAVRTAYNDSELPPDFCYLKIDVEKRALERWGSIEALEREKRRREEAMEEGERFRKDLSALIGHLKKTVKDQSKQEDLIKVLGTKEQREGMLKGSAKVVLFAVASNLTVSIMKFTAYFWTGSAAMLSEAIHSMADLANQVLLGFGVWQSIKQPSLDHPYGWQRSRYIYALISGCGIFFLGCGFSVYHGIAQILEPAPLENLYTAYGVLAASFLVEGATMATAFKQVQLSAKESGVSFREYVSRGRDPNAVAVLLEDSAALAGILIAATSLGLTSYTGNLLFDAIGSITIGGLLGFVAVFLIQRNADSLVGRSIDPDRLRKIINVLENDIMIRSIHDVKATDMGIDTIRFKAEINFDGREITRVHLNRLDTDVLLREVNKIKTTSELEMFMLEHGEQIIDVLGSQVDRIERNIKIKAPEVRHIDLEIL